MSVREEDRNKNSCPSRGLGIAAAAIGVGVGAALYYFFNKRQENPSAEGSSSDWSYERQQAFPISESDTSYTTISEHETSDTSVHSSSHSNISFTEEDSVISVESNSEEELYVDESDSSSESDSTSESDSESLPEIQSHSSPDDSDIATSLVDSDISISGLASDMHDVYYLGDPDFILTSDVVNIAVHSLLETGHTQVENIMTTQEAAHMVSDSENEWDITTSSLGVPEETARSSISSLIGRIGNLVSPRKKMAEERQMAILRQQAFRERSWTLEECSICFDVMLRNQDVTSLPCAHNFHTDCIMPWLQEKQTCPNCRKVAE